MRFEVAAALDLPDAARRRLRPDHLLRLAARPRGPARRAGPGPAAVAPTARCCCSSRPAATAWPTTSTRRAGCSTRSRRWSAPRTRCPSGRDVLRAAGRAGRRAGAAGVAAEAGFATVRRLDVPRRSTWSRSCGPDRHGPSVEADTMTTWIAASASSDARTSRRRSPLPSTRRGPAPDSCVLISGEAGIGKSAVLSWLADAAGPTAGAARVLPGRARRSAVLAVDPGAAGAPVCRPRARRGGPAGRDGRCRRDPSGALAAADARFRLLRRGRPRADLAWPPTARWSWCSTTCTGRTSSRWPSCRSSPGLCAPAGCCSSAPTGTPRRRRPCCGLTASAPAHPADRAEPDRGRAWSASLPGTTPPPT